MKLYPETGIRKGVDKPTIAVLDLWKSLSEQIIGIPIEVMIGNRKEQQQLRSFSGEINTAFPHIIEGKVRLVLWLEPLSDVKDIIITHEIGHWILKLRGFQAFQRIRQEHSNTEIMLNSMAQHPPLYALQRSFGHEPQDEIDSRCIHNIKLASKQKETKQREMWVHNALLFADDIFNSEENRNSLINVIGKHHPNTSKLVKSLMELESSYDLLVPDQNRKFCEQVIETLKLDGEWYNPDEVKSLVSMVQQAATNQSKHTKN
jgi:hypothetical protein